jgi:hypothetical protein
VIFVWDGGPQGSFRSSGSGEEPVKETRGLVFGIQEPAGDPL